jgi:hypothetical protein
MARSARIGQANTTEAGNGPFGRAALAAVLMLLGLGGCASTPPPELPAAASPPPPPPPPAPPPVDIGGRWKLSAAGGGSCFVKIGNNPGATAGTVAPEGGCPGNFFTSRKWTFEHDTLIIRNHKGEPLAQLTFADGRFEGQSGDGKTMTLSH